MRHGERFDTANPYWEYNTDRPYDTPITGKGKIEAYDIAKRRYCGKVCCEFLYNKIISF